jgi:hypothetical protein
MEPAHRCQGGFLPKTGQVEHTERTGDAGTDHRDEFHVKK